MPVLVATNHHRFLAFAARSPARAVSGWISSEVEFCAQQAAAQNGVVDLFSADRVFLSFAAARACAAPQHAAARCADGIVNRPLTLRQALREGASESVLASCDPLAAAGRDSAVCCGEALCGDFGSDAQQRYMVIGGVSSFVSVLERVAASWMAPILADAGVCDAVDTAWECRLRESVVYLKCGYQPHLIWEILSPKDGAAVGMVTPQESCTGWMYGAAGGAGGVWDVYNGAMLLWIRGKGSTARRAVDAAALSAALPMVRDALSALRRRITDDPMPSIVLSDVSAAAALPPAAPAAAASAARIITEARWQEGEAERLRDEERRRQQQQAREAVQRKRGAVSPLRWHHAQATASGNVPQHVIPMKPTTAAGMMDAFEQLAEEHEKASQRAPAPSTTTDMIHTSEHCSADVMI